MFHMHIPDGLKSRVMMLGGKKWSHVRRDKPKSSRTSTQKVRTGCVTCKKRHIKCDEAKPHCGNCISSRRHCEGYVVGLNKKKHAGPVQLCWDSKQTVHVAAPRLQHQPNPDFLDFRDCTSMLYFQEFVGLLQGSWNNAASCVVLPQVARSNATIRYAAMAIGSLSKWHQQSHHKSLRATRGEDAYYFHAVAYYCHALKMQSQQASVQDAVFLSVLSILRGNRKAALDHVNHGMALLLAVLTDRNSDHHITNLAPNPRPLLAAVADIFTNLAIQARTILRGRFGHGSPLPHLTKGLRNKQQTMESFMILLSRVQRPYATASDIPAAFTSLDEFEQRLTAARRDSTTMLMIMAEAIQKSGLSGSATKPVLQRAEPFDIQVSKLYKDLFDNPKLHAWCEPARQHTQVLEAAFMPLFHRIVLTEGEEEGDTRSGSSPAYLKALHLRMQYLSTTLFEDPPQYITVETVSALTPAFREYLSLARMALRAAADIAHNPARALSLQCSLAWHLLMLALFCRDPPARDDAVALLRDYPGQDGLWNTRALYAVALRNRAVERANAFEGTPTEQWQRLWRRELLFEDGGERILFRFLEKDATTGKWEWVEEAAEVPLETEVVRWERQPLTGSGGLFMVDIYSS
ncbi:hypothetical protein BKA80DRAFT_290933 [Phyllosticta citrichinensis]